MRTSWSPTGSKSWKSSVNLRYYGKASTGKFRGSSGLNCQQDYIRQEIHVYVLCIRKNQLEKGFQMVFSTRNNYRCWYTTFLLVIPTLLFGIFSFSVFNLAFHVHVLASGVDSELNSFTNPVYILIPDLMQCFLWCLSTK